MKITKKDWHDIKLMIITVLALITCPVTFYYALIHNSAVLLAVCILSGGWLFLFQLANGYPKGK
jgi:hypothetical protein